MVNLLNMNAKVIHIIKLKILTLVLNSASRVCTHHLFATSLGPLALNEMLVVKMIVSNGWTRVSESALLKRQPLVADAVGALAHLHEQRKLIGVGSTLTFRLRRLGFDGWFNRRSLDALTLDCFALVT